MFYFLDLLGTLAFGLAGFATAVRRRYDLWGAIVLTSLPAVGGGTVRDILVGGDRVPPFIFADATYVYMVMVIVVAGSLWNRLRPGRHSAINTDSNLFLVIDTVGLAVFSIIGAKVAILAQLDWFWIPFLAALTCAGGGAMMDFVTAREPRTFRGILYEELAILGGLFLLFLLYFAQYADDVESYIELAIVLTFIFVFGARVVAVKRGWTTPTLVSSLTH